MSEHTCPKCGYSDALVVDDPRSTSLYCERCGGSVEVMDENGDPLPQPDTIETLTRRLCEVTAERDSARSTLGETVERLRYYLDALTSVKDKLRTAEAALSRRDEALVRIVAHGSAMGPAGTATMLEIARAALALDALTKPQEAGQ
jgi:hypothetical protein